MFASIHNGTLLPEDIVVDLDTGEDLQYVAWANDEISIYAQRTVEQEILLPNSSRAVIFVADRHGTATEQVHHARIKIIKAPHEKTPVVPAAAGSRL